MSHPNTMIQSAGCPGITVNATQVGYDAQLQGWWGFSQTSNPAKLYRTYDWAWSGCIYTIVITGSGASTQTNTWSSLGSINYSNPQFTSPDNNLKVVVVPGSTTNTTSTLSSIILVDQTQPGPSVGTTPSSFSPQVQSPPFVFTLAVTSETVITYSCAHQNHVSGLTTYNITVGSATLTLSNPDTDTAAVGRISGGTTLVFNESPDPTTGDMPNDPNYDCASEWDVRTGTTTIDFNYKTLSYNVSFTNLFPGIAYTVPVVVSRRTASWDGTTVTYGAWSTYATNTITFTPSGTTYTTGDYTLPNTQGYEYAVSNVTLSYACP